jgi:antitoxin component YwqK of YwqJK toxin-antitoxin module
MKLFLRCFLFFFILGGIVIAEIASPVKLDKVLGISWGASMDLVQKTLNAKPLPSSDQNTLVFSSKYSEYDAQVKFYFYQDKFWKVGITISCDKTTVLGRWRNITNELERQFPGIVHTGMMMSQARNNLGPPSQSQPDIEDLETGKAVVGYSWNIPANPGEEDNQVNTNIGKGLIIVITYKNGELAAMIPGSFEAMAAKKTKVTIYGQNLLLKKATWYMNKNISSGIVIQPIDLYYKKYILPLAPGSDIRFHENGELNFCRLARDTSIQIGKNVFLLKGGSTCSFYKNGCLSWAILATNQDIVIGNNQITISNNIPSGEYAGIRFYEDESLQRIFVVKNTFITVFNQKAYLKENSPLSFYNNGNLSYGSLAQPLHITINNNQFIVKDNLELYPNGMVKHARSVNPIILSIENQDLSLYVASFYESGKIKDGYLTKIQKLTIKGIPFELADDGITFYENGKIKSCVITDECYQKIKVKATPAPWGYEVQFDESGNIVEHKLITG